MAEQQYRPHRWQRGMQRFPASRAGARLFARTLQPVDLLILRLSKGRLSIPTVLTGLPVIRLTTIGAKSGQSRTVPVLGFRDGDRVIVIGSNFGRSWHPAWYHNLRANPEAQVSMQGRTETYTAREATEAEREKYWRIASEVYLGFEAYRRYAHGRKIPVMVLTARSD